MPRCSIIIPVYNKAHLTRQCVDRLLALATPECPYEIIVVDDGSRDCTPKMLAGYGDRIRVVVHPQNKAFASSCNDGAAVARGQYLVFLNNDTIPSVGWLEALVKYIEARPRVGLVGSKLLYPNGTVQHAGVVICQDRVPRHLYVGFPADHPAVNKARRMQAVTGACNLISRTVFEAVGGFDTAYINCYEDIDLCLRIGALGYEIHYCPDSVLIHFESVSDGRLKFVTHSGEIFQQRWGDRLEPDDLKFYAEDGLLQVTYYATWQEFTVAPELGVIKDREVFGSVEKLLAQRAQQVHALIRENVVLRAAGAAPSAPLPAGLN
jgi:GT2 family glycosyltransferase